MAQAQQSLTERVRVLEARQSRSNLLLAVAAVSLVLRLAEVFGDG